ncbi:hypothetical protein PTKU64_94380 (plasmid) [Paraburkholderia terrae]|uniref:Uncharacterized protein n=1 Tax=Paraburkholderia terrae TaxID=311230 RepID=A0ABM7U366_9BURK|nr:hypothetical protein PTKU64_94380 [Paraburkholderia terrae]
MPYQMEQLWNFWVALIRLQAELTLSLELSSRFRVGRAPREKALD